MAAVSWLQWLVQINNVKELWSAQPTYLISQIVFLLAGTVTMLHSFRKGGRWPYFWLCTVLHGLYADNVWAILLPEYDNFWHSRTPVMLLGGRLPLHIIFLYPAFIYHAAYAVSKLDLPKFAEPFAVGLVTVLIDIPYDIVAVKFVHWTWHDTDPNVFDRHYWVPWTSYYFHATFAASLFFFFHASRRWLRPKTKAAVNTSQWQAEGKLMEWKSLIIAAALGMPGGVLMFVPIYHPLHDTYKIHTEVTVFVLFSIFTVIVLNGLLSERKKSEEKLTAIDYVLILQLAAHYIIYWMFVVFFNPANERSLGFHEPVGNCNEMTSLVTPFGQTLKKRKYFCVDDYDEQYFDFSCYKGPLPQPGDVWYLICGTPFPNHVEYITVLTTIVIFAGGFFYALYFRTAAAKKGNPTKKTKLN